jgi:hypothetical protein
MNVGPVNSGGVSMPMADTSNINAAQPSSDTSGGNSEIKQNNTEIPESEKEISGDHPKALKQMATSDFLSLKEISQGDNMMEKLEKIFETILALKLLEDTVKNVNESIEEASEGEQ